ncbi:MAG: hypothetical protein GC150_01700 [Rhizobiales bacterium]|nr:hypothetical protein [Hyphomicrobiales bacterium]
MNSTAQRRGGSFLSKVAVIVVAAGLGGCAADGIELNGKIFDVMGVSSAALNEANKERFVEPRAPLVMPPAPQLPEPAVPGTVHTAALDPAWPTDPDLTAKAEKALREKQIRAMCDDRDWMERTKPEEFRRITENGALCTTQAAEMLKKLFGGPVEDDDR